jgi:hypothetical protein
MLLLVAGVIKKFPNFYRNCGSQEPVSWPYQKLRSGCGRYLTAAIVVVK